MEVRRKREMRAEKRKEKKNVACNKNVREK